MKKIVLVLSLVSLIVFSCSEEPQKPISSHELRLSGDNKDSVVYVSYVDPNGHQNNFFLNYLMFRTLFANGGYSNCYNYYYSHVRDLPTTNYYSSYKPVQTVSNNSTRSYSSPVRSISSPSRSTSSPARSYSSPSRSYSSPVRSYSSPVRSYSSPVRSMSSPARGR